MISWLTSTTVGRFIATFLISMVPIIELRGGLPYGIAFGLDYPLALTAAVLGNMLPVPFIIVFINRIFHWMRRRIPKMDNFITKLENKAISRARRWRSTALLRLCSLWEFRFPARGRGRVHL